MKENCVSCARNVNGSVPMAVLENERAQANVDKRRHFIIILVLIALLFGSNLAWLIYEKQYETVTEQWQFDVDQEADDGGNTVLIGGDYYGKAEGNDYKDNDAPRP